VLWNKESERREKAREKRGFEHRIKPEEVEEYKKILSEAQKLWAVPTSPAMPCISVKRAKREAMVLTAHAVIDVVKEQGASPSRPYSRPDERTHQDKIAQASFASDEWFALVHTPIPMPKAMKIPKAKEAVDAEWDKLAIKKKAWDVNTVMARADVEAKAKREGKHVHFGSLMDLCHEKHSELDISMRKYKGRVVFRGDQVKDEDGFRAVFSEQGTSASHIAAAKFLDAIARMPGCHGEDSDAVGAYTQVDLEEAQKLGGVAEIVETWITLPPGRRPPSWSKIKNPVCKLRLNLYGHPLAGLYWEKHCQNAIEKAGFNKVSGWECLYENKEKELFLSVYVDDFKMAGNEANMAPMWATLGASIELEPPIPLDGNTYLGIGQSEVTPSRILWRGYWDLFMAGTAM